MNTKEELMSCTPEELADLILLLRQRNNDYATALIAYNDALVGLTRLVDINYASPELQRTIGSARRWGQILIMQPRAKSSSPGPRMIHAAMVSEIKGTTE